MARTAALALLASTVGLWVVAAQGIADCPGYRASNVRRTSGTITADLTLAGEPCNAYSDDLKDLRLLVEYQAKQRLHVRISDADQRVYQIPEDVVWRPDDSTVNDADSDLYF